MVQQVKVTVINQSNQPVPNANVQVWFNGYGVVPNSGAKGITDASGSWTFTWLQVNPMTAIFTGFFLGNQADNADIQVTMGSFISPKTNIKYSAIVSQNPYPLTITVSYNPVSTAITSIESALNFSWTTLITIVLVIAGIGLTVWILTKTGLLDAIFGGIKDIGKGIKKAVTGKSSEGKY